MPQTDKAVDIRLSEVLSALTYALDLTEDQPEGHAIRNCMIGMTLANHMQLTSDQRSALFYALLLGDLGCSSNAAKMTSLFGADDRLAKKQLKQIDSSSLLQSGLFLARAAGQGEPLLQRLRRLFGLSLQATTLSSGLIRTRCERGAEIARQLGFPEDTAQAILDLDELWNGKGNPLGKKGEAISLLGRVLGFAQTLEVFYSAHGPEEARQVARKRRGTWFDPALVDLFFETIAYDDTFWEKLDSKELITDIGAFEPPDRILHADQDKLDQIAEAFARVIDAKSPYTSRHSARVAEIVRLMAAELNLPLEQRRDLSRAALLHDIGKLAVSNTILDKPDKLNDAEWAQMRSHTEYTYRILERVRGFRQLAHVASAHHERLDGGGYHRGLPGGEMSQDARLLAVADQYEALTAARPYRQPLTPQEALALLEGQVGTGIDPLAFQALKAAVQKGAVPEAAAVQPITP
ncbi:MAG: HD domain-containing protein [Anaerolineales bacterium]|nr:HD domain-containing protein [Anaerolineales bacterium]